MLSPRRGFTLIELFTVLVIVGVVTGLSMSRFTQYLGHERVKSAAYGIANDLRSGFAIPGMFS